MDQPALELLLTHPLLVNDKSTGSLRGVLRLKDIDFRIETCQDNQQVLIQVSNKSPPINETTSYTVDPSRDLITQIEHACDELIPKVAKRCPAKVYLLLFHEYMELRQFFINISRSLISADLSSVSLHAKDPFEREHDLVVGVDGDLDIAQVFYVKNSSLPEKIDGEVPFETSASLRVIYQQFLSYVDQLQPFFNFLDAIHQCFNVACNRQTNKQKIYLGGGLLAIVTVNPYNMDNFKPHVQLIGPIDQTVQVESFVNDLDSDSILQVLSKIAEKSYSNDMKARGNENEEEFILCSETDCSICFCSESDTGCIPNIVCSNMPCSKRFHSKCLYQWLTAANARKSFNTIHGQCPSCEHHISCPNENI